MSYEAIFNCFNILDYITFEKEIKSNRIEYFVVYLTITSFVLKVMTHFFSNIVLFKIVPYWSTTPNTTKHAGDIYIYLKNPNAHLNLTYFSLFVYMYKTCQKFGMIMFCLYFWKSLILSMAAFIWSKYSKNSNNVKYYNN